MGQQRRLAAAGYSAPALPGCGHSDGLGNSMRYHARDYVTTVANPSPWSGRNVAQFVPRVEVHTGAGELLLPGTLGHKEASDGTAYEGPIAGLAPTRFDPPRTGAPPLFISG